MLKIAMRYGRNCNLSPYIKSCRNSTPSKDYIYNLLIINTFTNKNQIV